MRHAMISLVGLGLAASLGCLREAHPEFAPVVSVERTVHVLRPTVVVDQVVSVPAPAPATAAGRPAPPPAPLAARAAPALGSVDPLEARAPSVTTGPLACAAGGRSAPLPRKDAEVLTRCLADDPAACRALARLHMAGPVASNELTALLTPDLRTSGGGVGDINGGQPLRTLQRAVTTYAAGRSGRSIDTAGAPERAD